MAGAKKAIRIIQPCRLMDESMKSWILDKYGKGRALRLNDRPAVSKAKTPPALASGDVLVRIHAAALNPLDLRIRDGAFKAILPYKPPFVLGHDLAGVVEAVADGVNGFKAGDRVFARPRDGRIGTLAEQITVNASDLAHVPADLTMTEAAALPLVSLTAWQALVELGQIKPGQKVLVHAGSGGVGVMAIQLAKHLGAHVVTTASAQNASMLADLGADQIIDYRTEAFDEILAGFDLVLCGQDTATLTRSLSVLKPGGKLISLSGPPTPEFAKSHKLGPLLGLVFRFLSRDIRRKATAKGIHYHFLFMRADGGQLATIASLVEAKKLRPVIDRVFPFSEVNEAMVYLEKGHAKGKVVIDITGTGHL